MAQQVLGAVGAAVGYYFGGPTGAQIGWAVGSAIGSTFEPTQQFHGPRLEDLKLPGYEYGTPIPWMRGVVRAPGIVWWASEKHETATVTEQGKGGGGGAETIAYTYDIDLIIGLCDHEIACVPRIWLNGKLVYNVREDADEETLSASIDSPHWTRLAVYKGTADQMPDAVYEAAVGAANAPAYRGRAYVFIEGLQLGSSGQMPMLSFEVVVEGTQGTPKTLIQSYFEEVPGGNPWDNIACQPATASGATDNVIQDVGYVLDTDAPIDEFLVYDGVQYNGTDGATVEGFLTVHGNPNVEFTEAFVIDETGESDPVYRHIVGIYGAAATVVYDNGVFGIAYGAAGGGIPWGAGRNHWCFQHTADTLYFHVNGVQLWSAVASDVPAASGHVRVQLGGRGHTGDVAAQYTIDSFRVRQEVVYGSGNFTPPERLPPPDCNQCDYTLPTIREVVEAICARTGLDPALVDASELDAITKPVRSVAAANVTSARAILETLATSHMFECAVSDKLHFFPRATLPVATIPYADLGAALDTASPDPFVPRIGADIEIPAQVAVRYINWDNDHQSGAEYSDRVLSGQAATSVMELAVGLTPAEAKGIADAAVMDGVASAISLQLALPLDYAELEPGDVVTAYDADTRPWRLRLVRRKDASGVLTFDAVSDDQGALLSAEVTDGSDTEQGTVGAPSATVLALLDIPLLRDVDDNGGYYAAATGATSNWPGARLYQDAGGYAAVLDMSRRAVIGVADSVLAAPIGPLNGLDAFSHVDVTLYGNGELASTTLELMLAGHNAAALGDELIQFTTATLLTGSTYRLSGLLRGRIGTEQHVGTHAAGEQFVLLTPAGLYRQASSLVARGVESDFKAVTFGKTLAATQEVAFTNNAVAQMPLSPVHLHAAPASADTWFVWWQRRTRKGGAWIDGADASLGEAAELYDVELLDGGTVISTQRTSNRYATVGGSIVSTEPGDVLDYTSAVIDLRDWGGDIVGVRYGAIPLRDNGLVKFAADGSFLAVVAIGIVNIGRIMQIDVDGDNCYAAVTNATDTSYAHRVDRTSMAIEASYAAPLNADVQGVAFDGTNLWVAEFYGGKLRKLNGTTLALEDTFNLNTGIGPLVYQADSSDGALFICDRANDRIIEFDLTTETVAGYFTGCEFPMRVLVSGSCLFVVGRGFHVYDLATRGEIYTNPELEGFLVETPAGVVVSLSDNHPLTTDIVTFSTSTGLEVARMNLDGFRFLCGYAAGGLWVRVIVDGSPRVVKLVEAVSAPSSADLSVRVTQISAVVGDGFPASIDL